MATTEPIIAVLAGMVQGIVEWLPVSSQGNLSLFLTAIGTNPEVALQLALFLQLGTTISAVSYYRDELAAALRRIPSWQPEAAFEPENALVSYLLVASVATGLIGIPLYVFAVDIAGDLTGGIFISVIGVLLIITGLLQLRTESEPSGSKQEPTFLDACLVGAAQGIAILPGISRSGMTTSTLLFRSYEPTTAFTLAFLLSIPASIGAAVLTLLDAGGIPGISPPTAAIALVTSGIVGYGTIDILLRIVDRVPFWGICFGLGGVAIVGGGIITVVM
ncbi:undecaprenyl-diphosphate phosphatase [Halonotius sp. GCM10025705]|uniref:undecaprenyl-diphosphate phosphatase n=1 Tax=Halonotius sp. GCM10025705 TaxID=3252678 RepID=UPI00360E45F1